MTGPSPMVSCKKAESETAVLLGNIRLEVEVIVCGHPEGHQIALTTVSESRMGVKGPEIAWKVDLEEEVSPEQMYLIRAVATFQAAFLSHHNDKQVSQMNPSVQNAFCGKREPSMSWVHGLHGWSLGCEFFIFAPHGSLNCWSMHSVESILSTARCYSRPGPPEMPAGDLVRTVGGPLGQF